MKKKSFDEKVWQLLKRIPKGKVTTYKLLAKASGNANAARANTTIAVRIMTVIIL